ncbi:MAG TPA: YmdB family metallophosphoesterase, partial [Spirochaetales bacterium]|nr:YmdB family metallophosphoesterase [Spirochaetales bacterium]
MMAENSTRVLMIGDVIGDAGVAAAAGRLRALADETGAALVVVNGENAAGGFGLTRETADKLFAAGAD